MGSLKEDHFFTSSAADAWRRIRAMLRAGNEVPSWGVLCEDPALPESARTALSACRKAVLPKRDLDRAVETLDRYATLRGMMDLAQEMVAEAEAENADVNGMVDRAADRLSAIRMGTSRAMMHRFGADSNTAELIESVLSSQGVRGIPTMFDTWDDVNGVIPSTACMLIASTTGGGKSICAGVMCRNMAKAGFRPAIVPLEMSKEEMAARLMASVSGVSLEKVMQGGKKLASGEMDKIRADFKAWETACVKNGGSYMLWEPAATPTMTQLLHGVKPYQPDLIIVDYVALLDGVDGDDDWRRLSEAVREAKRFAVATQIPVIVIAQLGSDGDLRYSKRMKDDADLMWAWKGDEHAKKNGIIQVKQLKARNMNPFPFTLKIDWERADIRDMTDEEIREEKGRRKPMKDITDPGKAKDEDD